MKGQGKGLTGELPAKGAAAKAKKEMEFPNIFVDAALWAEHDKLSRGAKHDSKLGAKHGSKLDPKNDLKIERPQVFVVTSNFYPAEVKETHSNAVLLYRKMGFEVINEKDPVVYNINTAELETARLGPNLLELINKFESIKERPVRNVVFLYSDHSNLHWFHSDNPGETEKEKILLFKFAECIRGLEKLQPSIGKGGIKVVDVILDSCYSAAELKDGVPNGLSNDSAARMLSGLLPGIPVYGTNGASSLEGIKHWGTLSKKGMMEVVSSRIDNLVIFLNGLAVKATKHKDQGSGVHHSTERMSMKRPYYAKVLERGPLLRTNSFSKEVEANRGLVKAFLNRFGH